MSSEVIYIHPALDGALGAFVVLMGIIILILAFTDIILKGRKSQEYRKLMADLYVVGTIKKFAAEDKINLAEEYEEFKKFEKKEKLKNADVDITVSEELKDKISESNLKKAIK